MRWAGYIFAHSKLNFSGRKTIRRIPNWSQEDYGRKDNRNLISVAVALFDQYFSFAFFLSMFCTVCVCLFTHLLCAEFVVSHLVLPFNKSSFLSLPFCGSRCEALRVHHCCGIRAATFCLGMLCNFYYAHSHPFNLFVASEANI